MYTPWPEPPSWGRDDLVLFDDPAFDEHDPGGGEGWGHPESPARLPAIRAGLAGHPWRVEGGTPVQREDLLRVHEPAYIELIESTAGHSTWLDPDTATSPGSARAASLAAGAAVKAANLVAEGTPAFLLGRPPGHHATPNRPMGFCLFNHASVATAWLLEQGLKVAVVDPDVHHGNGTQEAFYAEPRVLYTSWHRSPFFPGTGHFSETGRGEGRGTSLNVPIPAGIDESVWLAVFRRCVLPAVEAFDPDVCVISVGFDALRGDLLGGMDVDPMAMGRVIADVVERWPAMAVLEGGYTIELLGGMARLAAKALAGAPWPAIDPEPPAPWARRLDAYEHPLLP